MKTEKRIFIEEEIRKLTVTNPKVIFVKKRNEFTKKFLIKKTGKGCYSMTVKTIFLGGGVIENSLEGKVETYLAKIIENG